MRKFKFIGTEQERLEYSTKEECRPQRGRVYLAEETIDDKFVSHWFSSSLSKHEWQEVVDEEKALRYNEGKPELSLIDLNSLKPCAEVLAFGAKKYSRNNWKKGFPLSSILNSMLRHIAALQDGEEIDPESGLPHIGHIQCNALFLGCKNNTNDLENV